MDALIVVFGTFALLTVLFLGGLAVAAFEELQVLLMVGGIVLFGVFIFAVESSGG